MGSIHPLILIQNLCLFLCEFQSVSATRISMTVASMDVVTARQTEEGGADSAMLTTTRNVRTKRVADLGHPTNGPGRLVILIIRRYNKE